MLIATLALLAAAGVAGGGATLLLTGSPLLALGAYTGSGLVAAGVLLAVAALRPEPEDLDLAAPAMPGEAAADAEFQRLARATPRPLSAAI